MKIKDGFVLRSAMDDNMVMPAGNQIGKFDGAIVLNDVGAFIWQKLENEISREDLVDRIVAEFDVDREKAWADAEAYLETLLNYGVLDEDK